MADGLSIPRRNDESAQQLQDLGQSLWIDNITLYLLNSGTLKRYIDELSVTGLTSNPTIFDHAINNSAAYDVGIHEEQAAPFTVNTMPEATLKVLADHGEIGPIMAPDIGNCEAVLTQFTKAGINLDALAGQLQDEGAKSFVKSWNELMAVIASKSDAFKKAAKKQAVDS